MIVSKLRPGWSKMRKRKQNSSHSRGAVANFNIAQTHIYLRFQYCLDKNISQYKGAPACFVYHKWLNFTHFFKLRQVFHTEKNFVWACLLNKKPGPSDGLGIQIIKFDDLGSLVQLFFLNRVGEIRSVWPNFAHPMFFLHIWVKYDNMDRISHTFGV